MTIRTCTWLHEAQFLVSVLAADGIDARVPDEFTLGSRPHLALALGGVRVIVPESDFERADEILRAVLPLGDDSGDER